MKPDFAKFGRLMWADLTKRYPDSATEQDEEAMELAQKCGLVERVPYDPEKHGEMDAEPVDPIWWWGKKQ